MPRSKKVVGFHSESDDEGWGGAAAATTGAGTAAPAAGGGGAAKRKPAPAAASASSAMSDDDDGGGAAGGGGGSDNDSSSAAAALAKAKAAGARAKANGDKSAARAAKRKENKSKIAMVLAMGAARAAGAGPGGLAGSGSDDDGGDTKAKGAGAAGGGGGSGSDDADGSGGDGAAGAGGAVLPLCKYGSGCKGSDPRHFETHRHPCTFGDACTRRNPAHFRVSTHPTLRGPPPPPAGAPAGAPKTKPRGAAAAAAPATAAAAAAAASSSSSAAVTDSREPCRYGAGCTQRNPEHRKRFAHPTDTPAVPGSAAAKAATAAAKAAAAAAGAPPAGAVGGKRKRDADDDAGPAAAAAAPDSDDDDGGAAAAIAAVRDAIAAGRTATGGVPVSAADAPEHNSAYKRVAKQKPNERMRRAAKAAAAAVLDPAADVDPDAAAAPASAAASSSSSAAAAAAAGRAGDNDDVADPSDPHTLTHLGLRWNTFGDARVAQAIRAAAAVARSFAASASSSGTSLPRGVTPELHLAGAYRAAVAHYLPRDRLAAAAAEQIEWQLKVNAAYASGDKARIAAIEREAAGGHGGGGASAAGGPKAGAAAAAAATAAAAADDDADADGGSDRDVDMSGAGGGGGGGGRTGAAGATGGTAAAAPAGEDDSGGGLWPYARRLLPLGRPHPVTVAAWRTVFSRSGAAAGAAMYSVNHVGYEGADFQLPDRVDQMFFFAATNNNSTTQVGELELAHMELLLRVIVCFALTENGTPLAQRLMAATDVSMDDCDGVAAGTPKEQTKVWKALSKPLTPGTSNADALSGPAFVQQLLATHVDDDSEGNHTVQQRVTSDMFPDALDWIARGERRLRAYHALLRKLAAPDVKARRPHGRPALRVEAIRLHVLSFVDTRYSFIGAVLLNPTPLPREPDAAPAAAVVAAVAAAAAAPAGELRAYRLCVGAREQRTSYLRFVFARDMADATASLLRHYEQCLELWRTLVTSPAADFSHAFNPTAASGGAVAAAAENGPGELAGAQVVLNELARTYTLAKSGGGPLPSAAPTVAQVQHMFVTDSGAMGRAARTVADALLRTSAGRRQLRNALGGVFYDKGEGVSIALQPFAFLTAVHRSTHAQLLA